MDRSARVEVRAVREGEVFRVFAIARKLVQGVVGYKVDGRNLFEVLEGV